MDVSITEINQFLRCRRAWHYQSQNRLGLSKIGVPSLALHIGSAVHAALEAHAKGRDVFVALDEWFAKTEAKFAQRYEVAVGAPPSPEELASITEGKADVVELIRRYFERYGWETPLGAHNTQVLTEQTFRVPIPDTDGTLLLTMDRTIKDAFGRLWIGEIKTYSKQPDLAKLQMEPQFSVYAWAAHALFGEPVAGIMYDGISKKIPKRPALLKKGGLSVAYDGTLDYRSYCDAIEEHGLDPHDYDDILSRLRERDAGDVTPFYARYRIPIHQAQVNAWAKALPAIYRDMTSDPAIYPTFAMMGCSDCFVKDLCHAEQFGEDVQWLMQNTYARSEGSQSFRQRDGEEVEVDAAAFA